jgi:hypothetical protein
VCAFWPCRPITARRLCFGRHATGPLCPTLSCLVLPCPAPSGEKRDVTLCRQRRAAAAFCDCGVEWFTRIPFSTLISRVLDLPKAGRARAAQRCLLLVALCTVPTRGLHCAVGRCVRSGTAKLKPCPSPTCPRADLPHIHPHHTRTQAHLARPIPSCPLALPASRRARIGHTPDHHLPMPLPCLALFLMPARPRPSTHPGTKENVPIQRCCLARYRQPRVHAHRHPDQDEPDPDPRRMHGLGCVLNWIQSNRIELNRIAFNRPPFSGSTRLDS